MAQMQDRLRRMPELLNSIHPTGPGHLGVAERGILALVNPERLRRILSKMLDENEFLWPLRHPLALEVPRAASLRLPRARPGVPGGLPAGRVEHRHVRRQFQLARPGLDAGERHDHPGPPAVLPVLRRQLQDRMPHGLRQDDEPLRGGQGDRRSAHPASSCATSMAGVPSTAARRSSSPIPTGATTSCSTNTSTATTVPGSVQAIRPAGPGLWPNSSSFSATWIPSGPWSWARRPRS